MLVWADGRYLPDLTAEHCEEFLKENRARPFFLYWAINLPHYPLQGSARWRKHYADLPAPRRMYAALVSTMDERIGRVLEQLDQLGLTDETIVIFQSDHGHSTEERTFGGGGNAGPYRGAKFSLFEGGIRVPAIVSWPGHLPTGVTRGQLATGCDWLPTIASLCGVPTPDRWLDGKDITAVLRSEDAPSPHETFHWQTGGGDRPQWAVRQGDWKLIGNPHDTSHKAPLGANDRLFLANLAEDPGEMKNQAADHPEIVQQLKTLHEHWIAEATEP
jgi:arylsulfatase A-like enzyme